MVLSVVPLHGQSLEIEVVTFRLGMSKTEVESSLPARDISSLTLPNLGFHASARATKMPDGLTLSVCTNTVNPVCTVCVLQPRITTAEL